MIGATKARKGKALKAVGEGVGVRAWGCRTPKQGYGVGQSRHNNPGQWAKATRPCGEVMGEGRAVGFGARG